MNTERTCEHHQMQLSALLDGELEPGAMRALLDHLLDCPDCALFYVEARDLQTLMDRLDLEAEAPAVTRSSARPRRTAWLQPSPAWGWAAAMVIAVVAGTWGAVHWRHAPAPGETPAAAGEAPVAIEVGDQAAPMDEARFVELTVELLRADERFRQEMSAVLKQVAHLRAEDGGDAL